MFARILSSLFVLALLASPAVAGHCPVDVKKIDKAIESADLSAADLAKVTSLRNEGDALHKAGNHGESLDALHEAMEILGIGH